ncbi:(d)CMP kinase [symbiont of Argiope bruennichi]|uniref:(d)CMP kinase n=1 Tax=symbiont of Argiope bruennichi TaxID=2810479 RepID=UPI003DA2E756
MKINFIVTIDGKSATGKSLIAKEIKKKYPEFFILDTGNFYRALTFFFLKNNVEIDKEKISNYFSENKLNICFDENNISVNNLKVEKTDLFEENINFLVAKLATILVVREKLLIFFQNISFKYSKIIAVGRDCGTNIFKNADLKFFVTSKKSLQFIRRSTQKSSKDFVFKRDNLDENRKISPLTMAEDAILIKNNFFSKKLLMKKIFYYFEKSYLNENL